MQLLAGTGVGDALAWPGLQWILHYCTLHYTLNRGSDITDMQTDDMPCSGELQGLCLYLAASSLETLSLLPGYANS